MHPRRPIPLYPHPPTQDNLLVISDESDFPAIREHNSTPDLPVLSDESSDFPPIRVRDSTPDLPTPPVTRRSRYRPRPRPSAVQQDSERLMEPRSPRFPRRSQPNKGLGRKNIVNMTAQRANNVPSSSKRPRESLDSVDNGHSSKRRRLAFKDSEELDQLKAEIGNIKAQTVDIKAQTSDIKVQTSDIKAETESIKECLWEISEHLQGDLDLKLSEIIHRIRQTS